MNTKKIIQLLLLGLFVILILTNRVQIWMGLFLVGIIGSFVFGRFYCGWFCSINTVMDYVTAFKQKHGIKDRKIPDFLKKSSTRWVLLGLFILSFVFTVKTGKKLPILPLAFIFGIMLTFFFHEELWHRYLCPYGSILSLSSKFSKKGITIDKDKCINCAKCVKVCPSLAIRKEDKHIVEKSDCLVCMRCIDVCPKEAIEYK